MTKEVSAADIEKIINFLEMYVEHLRKTGNSLYSYRADAIEDVVGRLKRL